MGESCPFNRGSVRIQLTRLQHPQSCSIKLKPFPLCLLDLIFLLLEAEEAATTEGRAGERYHSFQTRKLPFSALFFISICNLDIVPWGSQIA